MRTPHEEIKLTAKPNTDTQDDASRQNSFKEQLDQAAIEQREREQSPKPNPIVEKITEFVPAAAKVLGSRKREQPKEQPRAPAGPPERPDHDPIIETFVRDQHGSIEPEGDPDIVAQK